MIDRETAKQWANEAGMINFGGSNWQCVTDQIQALITRAQNEAYEQAACKMQSNNTAITDIFAAEIRAIKQTNGVKNDS